MRLNLFFADYTGIHGNDVTFFAFVFCNNLISPLTLQIASKYDIALEQEAREWIEAVIGEPIAPVSTKGVNPLGAHIKASFSFMHQLYCSAKPKGSSFK